MRSSSSYRLRAGGILATMGSKKKGSKCGGLSNPSPIAESLPSDAQLQENQLGAFRPVTPACYPRWHAFPPPSLTINSLFTALSRTTLRPPRLSSPSKNGYLPGCNGASIKKYLLCTALFPSDHFDQLTMALFAAILTIDLEDFISAKVILLSLPSLSLSLLWSSSSAPMALSPPLPPCSPSSSSSLNAPPFPLSQFFLTVAVCS